MSGDSKRRRTLPIGIDLGTRCVKLVQVVSSAGSDAIRAEVRALSGEVGRDWRAHEGELVTLIREMLRDGGFTGRRAVMCVPPGLLEYRNMRLDPTPAKAIESTVHERIAPFLRGRSRYTTQFLDAGEVWEDDHARMEIIAMAAPDDGLRQGLKLLKRCGLRPFAIDVTPGSMARALASRDDAGTTRVLIDLGHGSTTVTITHDGHIRFVKRLDTGLVGIDRVVADRLGIPLDEATRSREAMREIALAGDPAPLESVPDATRDAVHGAVISQGRVLAAELSKCLQYYAVTFHERRPDTGLVVGGGSRSLGVLDAVRVQAGLDLRPIDDRTSPPWIGAARELSGAVPPGAWAVAVGLSMYGAAAERGRDAA